MSIAFKKNIKLINKNALKGRTMDCFRSPIANGDLIRIVNCCSEEENDDHFQLVGQKLAERFDLTQKHDVCLVVKEKKFHCHYDALAAHSNIFSKATDPFRQTIQIIMEADIPAESVVKIIEFCYFGEFACDYTTVYGCCRTAAKLQITELVKLCRGFLHRLLTPANLSYTVELTEHSNVLDLFKVAFEKYINSFYAIIEDEQYLRWEVSRVIRFLALNEMRVNTEYDVFMAAFKWLDADRQNRLIHLTEVMRCARYGNMTIEELVRCGKFDPVVNDHPEVRQMIADATWMVSMSEAEKRESVYLFPLKRVKPEDMKDFSEDVQPEDIRKYM